MPSIRIAASAALLVLSCFTAGGAAAQTTTDQAPGGPLQLLHWLHAGSQTSKPTTKPHAKTAERKTVRSAAAFTKHRRHPTETAAALPSGPISPAANIAAPTETTTTLAPTPPAGLMPGVPVPSELVVAGQTVQLAAPNEVNELDLAANNTQPLARGVGLTGTASPVPLKSEAAETTSKSDSLIGAPHQASASQISGRVDNHVGSQVGGQVSSQVGSASWIAKVLAALGGAVAAGSAAWFLIGLTPQRTYG